MTTQTTATKRTEAISGKATCVIVAGPFSIGPQGFNGIEQCEYCVYLADDCGDAVGKVYRVRSGRRARQLGADMAQDRHLEFVDDTFPE